MPLEVMRRLAGDRASLSPYAGGGWCGAGERHASLTCGGGERRMLLSRHTISILDENRHRQVRDGKYRGLVRMRRGMR